MQCKRMILIAVVGIRLKFDKYSFLLEQMLWFCLKSRSSLLTKNLPPPPSSPPSCHPLYTDQGPLPGHTHTSQVRKKRKIHNKLTNRIKTISNPQTFQSIMHRGSLYLVTFSNWTMTMDCSCPPPLCQSSPRWWRGSSRRRRPRRPKKPRKAQ